VIHDADDAGVCGGFGREKRKRRFAAADEEDVLPNARADRVEGDERTA
jgi:hypothetical protein